MTDPGSAGEAKFDALAVEDNGDLDRPLAGVDGRAVAQVEIASFLVPRACL